MPSTTVILIVLAATATYALLSRRLAASVISLPMIFTALGLLLGPFGFGLVSENADRDSIQLITEATLILVLFADASQVKLSALRKEAAIPARMLLIGMPLSVVIGTFIAKWVSPDSSWFLALLVAAILTPTDAALGQSVVTSPAVPKRLSQSINVESGLNDGLALPVVLIAAVLATNAAGISNENIPNNVALFTLLQLTLGPLTGIVVGTVAARLLDVSVNHRSATTVAQGLYFLTTAFIIYFGAEAIGGNGFIAAFVGGLTFGNVLRSPPTFIVEFMEGEGQLLTVLTFFIFGAVLAPLGLTHIGWRTFTLAVLFLTFVRLIPIWIALKGLNLSRYDKLFLGWFGPRGLASILFALLVLDEFPVPGINELAACVVLTVLMSIVLHGVSAVPLSNRFRRP